MFLLKFYKKYISIFFTGSCKYYPSCSDYCFAAVEKFGVIRGGLLGLKRFLKCNPFSKGGYDPVK